MCAELLGALGEKRLASTQLKIKSNKPQNQNTRTKDNFETSIYSGFAFALKGHTSSRGHKMENTK